MAQVVLVFRRDRYAFQAVRSALDQRGSDAPVLIVTPWCDLVLREFRRKDFLEVVNVELPCSPGRARNLALRVLRDYSRVLFLDDDDLSAASRCVMTHAADESQDILFGHLGYIDESGFPIASSRSRNMWTARLERELLLRNPVHQSSVGLKPESVFAVGGYKEEMRRFSDYDLWLRMAANGARFGLIQGGEVGKHRIHSGQMTHSVRAAKRDLQTLKQSKKSLAERLLGRRLASSIVSSCCHSAWVVAQGVRSVNAN